jgi:hypothetical protein
MTQLVCVVFLSLVSFSSLIYVREFAKLFLHDVT